MLRTLTIRDFVLIKNLTVPFTTGLCVLTGETGGGKSILLDALGLALGGRGDSSLVAPGASQATVSADFEIPKNHPALALAKEHGLGLEGGEDTLILRRILTSDGRGRAFVNDQPVTVGTLKALGDELIEIHGQHDDRGLLNPKGHRALLDAFGGYEKPLEAVGQNHQAFLARKKALEGLEEAHKQRQKEEEYDRHCFEELKLLDPKPGEEEDLATARKMMMEGEKSGATVNEILQSLDGEEGAEMTLRRALRRLERLPENLKALLEPSINPLAKAAAEAEAGIEGLRKASEALEFDPQKQEQTETRLFEIRAQARKHQCRPDDLPKVLAALQQKLAALEKGDEELAEAREEFEKARKAFEEAARNLTRVRKTAAQKLDRGVAGELKPLKLEKARFRTVIKPLDKENWGPEGAETIAFEVSTNPGAPFGPLIKIASGGELSRFILALKVVLASAGSAPTLIFDEVDRGVGGAVADAVGERLSRLSGDAQVLVVTHSPQVAARAGAHFLVGKRSVNGGAETTIEALDAKSRKEEIARMLSGSHVTEKARAAAESLISGGA